jgi:hypothetical protein
MSAEDKVKTKSPSHRTRLVKRWQAHWRVGSCCEAVGAAASSHQLGPSSSRQSTRSDSTAVNSRLSLSFSLSSSSSSVDSSNNSGSADSADSSYSSLGVNNSDRQNSSLGLSSSNKPEPCLAAAALVPAALVPAAATGAFASTPVLFRTTQARPI